MTRPRHHYIFPLVQLLLVGTAYAEPRCQEPWPTKADLMTLAPDVRQSELARLMACVKQSLSDLASRTKAIENLDFGETVGDLAAQRDAESRLSEERKKRLNMLESALIERLRERDGALSEASQLSAQVQATNKAARAMEVAMVEQQLKLSALDRALALRTEELVQRSEEKSQADEKISRLEQTILVWQSERSGLEAAIIKSVKKTQASESKIDALEISINQFEAKEAAWIDERARSQAQMTGLEAKLTASHSEAAASEAERKLIAAARAETAEELARIKAQNTTLGHNLAALQKEYALLSKDVMGQEKELSGYKVDRERLVHALEDARHERDRSQTEITRLLQGAEAAERQLVSLQSDLKSGQDRIRTIKAEVKEAAGALARASHERDHHQNQAHALQAQVTTLGDENLRYASAVASLEERLHIVGIENARLQKFRSDFFSRLTEKLSKYKNIRVKGDRFIIETEVLFAVGSAELNESGKSQMHLIGGLLKDIASEVAPDLRWVLQVNGHTDVQKIGPGGRFASNWELSAARALSVVKLLQADGADPMHLAAAGFGEFQPIDPALTEDAYRKNRRIEIKITDDGPARPERMSALN